MDVYTLDFETYWAQDYTLSKMPCEAYVRDPRFKMHMVGIKLNDGATHVLSKQQFENLLDQGLRDKLNKSALLCQNTSFDAFILAHHYGVKPIFYLDTMSMFRAVYPHKRASLKVIAETLGLGAKGGESGYNVVNTRNKETLTAWEYQACAEYCRDDVKLAYQAFQILKKDVPVHELKLIDATIRMFTDPILVLNPAPLIEELEYEQTRKAELLTKVGEDKTVMASNPKFAGLLQGLGVIPPVKPSPTALKKDKELQEKVNSLKAEGVRLTPAICEENEIPWAWAFGKSDVEFKHLLNHDDPMVVAAVEARLGVKSNIAETRAERFIGIAKRGTLPVPLSYWGAATGRWAGAEKLNLQNLQRGSRLRKAIEAPDGYLLAVCDLSAIEARVLAWIAGQEDALEVYRTGGDIYCEMASKIYNRHVTKKDKQFRMVGKIAVLGCLGPETNVLTNRGWVRIVDVTVADTIWDGDAWVQHQGVVKRGIKRVQTSSGLTATRDHEILTEHGWREWHEVRTKTSLFQSALRSASLPSSNGFRITDHTNQKSSVHAGGKGWSTVVTSYKVEQNGAIPALKSSQQKHRNTIGGTQTSCRMKPIEHGCSIEYPPASLGATTQITEYTDTTEGGVYSCTSLGAQTDARSWPTLLRLKDGTSPRLSWTELTVTKATSRVISGLSRGLKTWRTNDKWAICRTRYSGWSQRMQTYDIAYAGPKNRFAVLTSSGPILVHNCGYGMGWRKFQEFVVDMAKMEFTIEDADQLGVGLDRFLSNKNNQRFIKIACPSFKNEHDFAVHCAVSEFIIQAYRVTNYKIERLWNDAGAALFDIAQGIQRQVGEPEGVVLTSSRGFEFPLGRAVKYAGLEQHQNGRRIEWTRITRDGIGHISPGLATENIIQALARHIMADQMLQLMAEGYRIVLTCHDEIVLCEREDRAEAALKRMEQVMSTPPAWAVGLPLACEGSVAKSYGDAK